MARAIVLREHGAADVLRCESVAVGSPGPGELRVRQTAIGVNFHDTYVRSGQYRTLPLPGIPGIEAVGVVEAVGSDVSETAVGDRIVYMSPRYGAYASERILPASLAVPLPDDIDDATAASIFVRGLTVEMLTQSVRRLSAGDIVLVHAAAGGVGRLLVQRASRIGAHVIGTVGSPEKAVVAMAAGCKETILYREENFVDRVREITSGRGTDVVYDSVGDDTVRGSFACLKACGHLIIFGQSSGPPDPIEISLLAEKSTTVSRPILFHYVTEREQLQTMSAALFQALRERLITPPQVTTMALDDAMSAHRFLEDRSARGAVVLVP